MAFTPPAGGYIEHTVTTIPSDAYYISFLMRTTTSSKQAVAGRASNISAGGATILLNDTANRLALYYKSNGNVDLGTVVPAVTVNDGNWHGVVVALPGQNGLGFDTRLINVDGTEATAGLAFSSDSEKSVRIGRTKDTFFAMYTGDIAEFAIYNGQLTADERNALASKKLRPIHVAPQKITAYNRLIRDTNDLFGDWTNTVSGSWTSVVDHPVG